MSLGIPTYYVTKNVDEVERSTLFPRNTFPKILISQQSFNLMFTALDKDGLPLNLSTADIRKLRGKPKDTATYPIVELDPLGEFVTDGTDGKVLFTVNKDLIPDLWAKANRGKTDTPIVVWIEIVDTANSLSYQLETEVRVQDDDRIGTDDALVITAESLPYSPTTLADWTVITGAGNEPTGVKSALDELAKNQAQNSHSHANKAILDATTASFLTTDKTKLDFISVTQVVDLDAIESDTATNKANADASKAKTDLITITQAVDLDAIETDSHTHTNKAILDATEESFLTTQKALIEGASQNIRQIGNTLEIDSVEGAVFDASITDTTTGALVFTLPNSWTATMVAFEVEILEWNKPSRFLKIEGYDRVSSWEDYPSAILISGEPLQVRLGHDGAKTCLVLGDVTSTWSYASARIINFTARFGGATLANWDKGWSVSAKTSLTGYTFTFDEQAPSLTRPDILCLRMGTLAPPTAPALLAYDETLTSQGITYNATTKRSTVSKSGRYRINSTNLKGAVASRVIVGINTDTPTITSVGGQAYDGDTALATISSDATIPLNAGDFITAYLHSGTLYNASSDRFNTLTIERVGDL